MRDKILGAIEILQTFRYITLLINKKPLVMLLTVLGSCNKCDKRSKIDVILTEASDVVFPARCIKNKVIFILTLMKFGFIPFQFKCRYKTK